MESPKKRFDDGPNPSRVFNVQTAATRLHFAVTRRIFPLILACLILDSIATTQTGASTGRINGTVSVLDSGSSYVPGAKVKLSGAASVEQQTDQEGRFSFDKVPPGTDTIAAEFPGLQAEQNITVEVGKVANVAVWREYRGKFVFEF
jgi:hypothetical protein